MGCHHVAHDTRHTHGKCAPLNIIKPLLLPNKVRRQKNAKNKLAKLLSLEVFKLMDNQTQHDFGILENE